MKIKEIEGVVHTAWSPADQTRISIATGTAAQQIDPTFNSNTNSKLEIYDLNIEKPNSEMRKLASATMPDRIHKLLWSSWSPGSNGGVLIAACDNGHISVFDANKLLANDPDPLLFNPKNHSGPVKTMDLNCFKNNLLASGSVNSELLIWDLNNFGKAMSPGAKLKSTEEVVSVAWNKQLQHILSSALPTKCLIWDLKRTEPVVVLADQATGTRWKSVAWHPEIATLLCLASEDDQKPVIQLWDVRHAKIPIKEFRKHQKGILDMSWSRHDSDFLLSSSKDNTIFCWNPNRSVQDGGEVLGEIAQQNQYNFDINWCERDPALFSCSSFDGFLSVFSILGGSRQTVQVSSKIQESFAGVSDLIAPPPLPSELVNSQSTNYSISKAPKWMKKPNGAFFAFGGKLIVFNNRKQVNIDSSTDATAQSPVVKVFSVVTENDFLKRSKILNNYCLNDNFYEYCCWKKEQNLADYQKDIWNMLTFNFNSSSRNDILEFMGIKKPELPLSSSENGNGLKINSLDDFESQTTTDSDSKIKDYENDNFETTIKKFSEFKIKNDAEGEISKSLLAGDFKKAIYLCIEQNRMTDAILIALNGNSELLSKVQQIYFAKNQNSVTAIIETLFTKNWLHLIDICNLSNWKDIFAAISCHCKDDETFYYYCGKLAEKLSHENRLTEALICYCCSGNCDEFIRCFSRLNLQQNRYDSTLILDLIEMVLVLHVAFQKRSQFSNISKSTSKLIYRFASILISQGDLETAVQYIDIADENMISDLKNRLIAKLKGPETEARKVHYPIAEKPQQTIQQMQQPQQHYKPQSVQVPPVTTSITAPPMPSSSYAGSARMSHPTPSMPMPIPLMRPVASQSIPQPETKPFRPMMPTATSVTPPAPAFASNMNAPPPLPLPSMVPTQSPLPQPSPMYPPLTPQPAAYSSSVQTPINAPLPAPNPIQSSGFPASSSQFSHQSAAPPPIPPPSNQSTAFSQKNILNRNRRIIDPSLAAKPAMPMNAYNPNLNSQFSNPNPMTQPQPQSQYPFQQPQMQQQQSLPPPPPIVQQSLSSGHPTMTGLPPRMSNIMPGTVPPPSQPGPSSSFPLQPPIQQSTPMTTGAAPPLPSPSPSPMKFYPLTRTDEPATKSSSPMFHHYPTMQPSESQRTPPQSLPLPQQHHQQQTPSSTTGQVLPGPNILSMPNTFNQTQSASSNSSAWNDPPSYLFKSDPMHSTENSRSATPNSNSEQQNSRFLPDNCLNLHSTFENLKFACLRASGNNSQMVRKMENISKKLDILYAMLSNNEVSQSTFNSLNEIAISLQNSDYNSALAIYTRLVSGPDFTQITNFMPGVKMLIQNAQQLQITFN